MRLGKYCGKTVEYAHRIVFRSNAFVERHEVHRVLRLLGGGTLERKARIRVVPEFLRADAYERLVSGPERFVCVVVGDDVVEELQSLRLHRRLEAARRQKVGAGRLYLASLLRGVVVREDYAVGSLRHVGKKRIDAELRFTDIADVRDSAFEDVAVPVEIQHLRNLVVGVG